MSQFADRHYRSLLLLIWLLGCALLLLSTRGAIADWRMGDPDDQLRMVQVRDWLAGQSWWDITQYRMNPPYGGPMHWSRLVDVPIATVIVLLTPLIGQPVAEQAAAAIVPLLTYGVVLALYGSTARKLFGKSAALVAAASFLFIIPAIVQLAPMRIDHHGWQLALFFAMMRALFDRQAPLKSGAIIGFCGALWIEISIEGLPFAAIFVGLLALRWIFPVANKQVHQPELPFAMALAILALGCAFLFSITESWSAAINYCDGLSPVHVFAFAAIASVIVAGLLSAKFAKLHLNPVAKLALCAVAGLGGIAMVFLTAPQCMGDAFGTLDPLVREYWFDRTAEGLPIWAVSLSYYAPLFFGLATGFIGLGYILLRPDCLPRDDKLHLALLYMACIVVGAFVMRTSVYALCVANMLLAPMIITLLAKAEQHQSVVTRIIPRIIAVFLPMSLLIGQNVVDKIAAAQSVKNVNVQSAEKEFIKEVLQCQKPASVAALGQLPNAQLMAGLDLSPAILLLTEHKVIATGHHRNQAAMSDVIRTFTGSVQQAERIFRERRVQYRATCDGSFEMEIYTRRAPKGFLAQIKQGSIPEWLTQQPDIGPFHIFKVNLPISTPNRTDGQDKSTKLR